MTRQRRARRLRRYYPGLSASGAPFDRMPLSTLIEEVVAPHLDFDVAIKVRIAVAGAREPVGTRNPAILYGVGNILENAVDFAREQAGDIAAIAGVRRAFELRWDSDRRHAPFLGRLTNRIQCGNRFRRELDVRDLGVLAKMRHRRCAGDEQHVAQPEPA